MVSDILPSSTINYGWLVHVLGISFKRGTKCPNKTKRKKWCMKITVIVFSHINDEAQDYNAMFFMFVDLVLIWIAHTHAACLVQIQGANKLLNALRASGFCYMIMASQQLNLSDDSIYFGLKGQAVMCDDTTPPKWRLFIWYCFASWPIWCSAEIVVKILTSIFVLESLKF